MSRFLESRISCFSSGALLEGWISVPGKRKMKFQYYSSCLKSISLNLFLRIFGIIVFFLKIWQFTTSRTPLGAPCHLRPGVLPGKFPYRPVGTGTRSREIPVPAGGYGNSAGSSVTARGARLLPFRDTISNLCSNTPRPLKGSAD